MTLHPFAPALGSTVLHFLWEGTLLGLLGAVVLRLCRHRRPEIRYALACLLLVAMVGCFVGTFIHLAFPGGAPLAPMGSKANGLLLQEVAVAAPAPLRGPGWEALLPWIALLWSTGAGFMVLRTGSGFLWLRWGLLKQSTPAAQGWQARLEGLRQLLGPQRPVTLRVSERLDTPLVMGILRPMILVPASVLASMDPDLLETILLHELAHIRRNDYLVNMLQTLAESLLFFHPAVWWLSRVIRTEREHCCDDAAVRRCGDPLRYASALAALEALRHPQPTFIRLAPAAKGGPLMFRIQRILASRTQTGRTPVLLPILAVATLLVVAGATGRQLQAHTPAPVASAPLPAPKPAPEPAPVVVSEPAPAVTATVTSLEPLAPLPLVQADKPATPSATVEVLATAQGALAAFSEAKASEEAVAAFFGEVPFGKIRLTGKPSAPTYPAAARAKGIQGIVTVAVIVGQDGKVRSVRALAGPEELLTTATDYAKQWSFQPPIFNGGPSEGRFILNLRFRLLDAK